MDKLDNALGHGHNAHEIERYIYGILYALIVIISSIVNGIMIFVMISSPINNPLHVLLFGLAVGDLILSVFGTSITCISYLTGTWHIGHTGCIIYGLLYSFLGLTQIMILSGIAFTRYIIVVTSDKNFTIKRAKFLVVGCYVFCLLISLSPVLGWSSYVSSGSGYSCGPNWKGRTMDDLSYNLFLMITCFIAPLLVILYSYYRIYRKVKRKAIPIRNRKRKLRVTNTILIMITFFLISWTPYAALSVLNMISNTLVTDKNIEAIPEMFAKSSPIWNPIIYFIRDNKFRKLCREKISCLRVLDFKSTPAVNVVAERETEIPLTNISSASKE